MSKMVSASAGAVMDLGGWGRSRATGGSIHFFGSVRIWQKSLQMLAGEKTPYFGKELDWRLATGRWATW